MPETTHDLIAAKAARLREFQSAASAAQSENPADLDADDGPNDPGDLTWSGGGWAN